MLIPQELQLSRFRPLDYACLSVELLQSPAADCMIRCSGPFNGLERFLKTSVVIVISIGSHIILILCPQEQYLSQQA